MDHTSKATKKRVTFFITFTNVFFILVIKTAFLTTFFYLFPNIYYNYGSGDSDGMTDRDGSGEGDGFGGMICVRGGRWV